MQASAPLQGRAALGGVWQSAGRWHCCSFPTLLSAYVAVQRPVMPASVRRRIASIQSAMLVLAPAARAGAVKREAGGRGAPRASRPTCAAPATVSGARRVHRAQAPPKTAHCHWKWRCILRKMRRVAGKARFFNGFFRQPGYRPARRFGIAFSKNAAPDYECPMPAGKLAGVFLFCRINP